MKKRFGNMFLALLYTLAFVQAPAYAHFCSGELESLQWSENQGCCAPESEDDNCSLLEASCCNDLNLPQLEIDVLPEWTSPLIKSKIKTLPGLDFQFKSPHFPEVGSILLYAIQNHSPPLIRKIYILFNQILVYDPLF